MKEKWGNSGAGGSRTKGEAFSKERRKRERGADSNHERSPSHRSEGGTRVHPDSKGPGCGAEKIKQNQQIKKCTISLAMTAPLS